jgi:hypothetical protein
VQVMEQLVDVVYYLYQEIHDNFGPGAFSKEAENFYKPKTASLGTSGLSLHYANIINQIDNLVCTILNFHVLLGYEQQCPYQKS